jgi:prepilin peptidase CpaA
MGTTALFVCVLVAIVAAVFDLATRKIPNVVTLGGAVAGLGIHAAMGAVGGGVFGAFRGLGFALGGAALCGIIPFISWRRNEMGGGDVKLFVAIGALAGPIIGFNVQAIAFVLMLVFLVPLQLLRHGGLRQAKIANARIAFGNALNVLRRRSERLAYVSSPAIRPVVLAPTIGAALLITILQHGLVA